MTREEAIKLLHAYADGELDPAASLEMEARLAADPALRSAHERLRGLSRAIREGTDYHPAPPGLRERLAGSMTASKRTEKSRAWLPIAAIGAAALLILALAAVLLRPADDERLLNDVLASHARATLGQRMIDVASSDQHTVKPWLSARLPFSPPVADYAAQGYALAGARADYAGGRPLAVLVYRRRQHTLEVFVAPGADAAPHAYSRDGLNMASFAQGGMQYWLVSDISREELDGLARLLRGA
jgi:anti-sigma factor RsiW